MWVGGWVGPHSWLVRHLHFGVKWLVDEGTIWLVRHILMIASLPMYPHNETHLVSAV